MHARDESTKPVRHTALSEMRERLRAGHNHEVDEISTPGASVTEREREKEREGEGEHGGWSGKGRASDCEG